MVDLYIRVSTDKQAKDGDSLEEQESELKKFCDYRNFKIRQVLVERGKSAKNTQRPEYKKLVADIQAGKIKAVVVKKLDRLSRSLVDFEQLMGLLQTHGVEFISLRENFDTTTAMGKAMLRIALVFAQLEREQTSERITDVMAYRASIGLHNGGIIPLGYTCVDRQWVVYKKEKDLVELIFKQFVATRSTGLTAAALNHAGFKTRKNELWDMRRILDILQNPAYLGIRVWGKKQYPNTHPPIISEKLFAEVQALLKSGKKIEATHATFQKLLVCGICNTPMSPSYCLNRTKTRYYYYRCAKTPRPGVPQKPCTLNRIAFGELDRRVLESFKKLGEPAFLTLTEAKIQAHNATIQKELDRYKADYDELTNQMDAKKASQDKFLEALILPHLNQTERNRIEKKLQELDTHIAQLKTLLAKNELELNQKTEDLLDPLTIKRAISGCLNAHNLLPPEYKTFIQTTLVSVTITKTTLTFVFRWLPWPWEVKTNPLKSH
ncbi:MAG: recombinase family protein [Candidatus Margulisiibacteriota bacterium]